MLAAGQGADEDLARNLRLYVGDDASLRSPARALRSLPTPPAMVRALQRLRVKTGMLDWERRWLAPLIEARRDVLGPAASGPPRFLVRVDEFPGSAAFDDRQGKWLDASRRLHEVMASAGVSHLMAILPEPAHDPLNPAARGQRGLEDSELELIETMRGDGVTLAQHGTTHRTLHADPRRRSELLGLDATETARVLDRGRDVLRAHGIDAKIFVAPFNRFGHTQWPALAERYEVVCGGPESIALMGYHGGPLWRGEAAYLPCYHPLYAHSRDILPTVEHLIDLAPGIWIPVVLHTAWETDDNFRSLERLVERLAPFACSWEDLLGDLERSRQ
jgi:hypothetical protein